MGCSVDEPEAGLQRLAAGRDRAQSRCWRGDAHCPGSPATLSRCALLTCPCAVSCQGAMCAPQAAQAALDARPADAQAVAFDAHGELYNVTRLADSASESPPETLIGREPA